MHEDELKIEVPETLQEETATASSLSSRNASWKIRYTQFKQLLAKKVFVLGQLRKIGWGEVFKIIDLQSFKFVLKRGIKRISIINAKREAMLQGLVQNVTGMEALADVEDLTLAYEIVIHFFEWGFLISEYMKVREHEHSISTTSIIPSFENWRVKSNRREDLRDALE